MANAFVSNWIPPRLRYFANRALGTATVYKGPYLDWQQAERRSAGYNQEDILARVVAATNKVLAGEADYEQDGKAMHGVPPPSLALSALLIAAATNQGRLSVLDFGGGLGSHYLRWRKWLSHIPNLDWCVVEQSHFVSKGNQLFDEVVAISFAKTIIEASHHNPNVILASGVLQYLYEPLSTLSELTSLGAEWIILDRLPFNVDEIPRIITQHVPRTLGTASYPLWLSSRASTYACLSQRYRMFIEFPSHEVPIRSIRAKGICYGSIWERKD